MEGLSPPTRGNPNPLQDAAGNEGSIPAHAGQPWPRIRPRPGFRVYPRPRGATTLSELRARLMEGLSPPTRGNRRDHCAIAIRRGSIPAHAGQPATRSGRTTTTPVYPRPRGATPRESGLGSGRGRSIPAHAGQPSTCVSELRDLGVYPRPRGATDAAGRACQRPRGLSPPTRGNPRSTPPRTPKGRSIPRPRGATEIRRWRDRRGEGLSPPTRGNPGPGSWTSRPRGSIPAHAGQPRSRRRGPAAGPVYPRPRGATFPVFQKVEGEKGLSPPTRGNPHRWHRGGLAARSIPAHAGQPVGVKRVVHLSTVYPRPRGATGRRRGGVGGHPGLSPPTRGNPWASFLCPRYRGSIPAHAGQPAE